MLPNVPAMVDAHFGIPMAGAVINALNVRLEADTVAYILDHGDAKVLLTDPEYSGVIKAALARTDRKLLVVDVPDPVVDVPGERLGELTYDELLAEGDPTFDPLYPADEWQAIALGYTSGTTGRPKGVVTPTREWWVANTSSPAPATLKSMEAARSSQARIESRIPYLEVTIIAVVGQAFEQCRDLLVQPSFEQN